MDWPCSSFALIIYSCWCIVAHVYVSVVCCLFGVVQDLIVMRDGLDILLPKVCLYFFGLRGKTATPAVTVFSHSCEYSYVDENVKFITVDSCSLLVVAFHDNNYLNACFTVQSRC